jgi:hypothetical protein
MYRITEHSPPDLTLVHPEDDPVAPVLDPVLRPRTPVAPVADHPLAAVGMRPGDELSANGVVMRKCPGCRSWYMPRPDAVGLAAVYCKTCRETPAAPPKPRVPKPEKPLSEGMLHEHGRRRLFLETKLADKGSANWRQSDGHVDELGRPTRPSQQPGARAVRAARARERKRAEAMAAQMAAAGAQPHG